MIIIDDANGILNLNHMAIYLMLTAEEKGMYGEKLKRLNNFRSITHGIFRFEIVEKGDTPYEKLPKDMTRGAAKNCNVLVRLINSIHNTYCYGLDYVDLTEDEDKVRENLKEIVDDICRKNIYQLDILCERNTSTAYNAVKMYRDSRIVAEVFEKALKGKSIKKEECPTLQLQKVSATSDLAESNAIAKDAFTCQQSEKIERERCERIAPETRPTISMSIKTVPYKSKTGKEMKSFGLELTINGDVVNIQITHNDWKVLYLAIVMAKFEDKRLRRRDFSYDSNTETKRWLERVFSTLRLNDTFTKWFDQMNKYGSSDGINKSKSNLNTFLWKYLSPQYKDAYHYVFVENSNSRKTDSHYRIHINREHIHVADYILEHFNGNSDKR